jgi:flap endonuclease-1
MGIKNLIKLINKYSPNCIKYKKIDEYANKIMGIDTNLLIYKMIYAIRLNGYDIKNGEIIVTHIHTFLQKICGFLKYNIKPVFVFDGDMPQFKENTIKKRNNNAYILQQKYYAAKNEQDMKKYYYMKSNITDREIADIIKIINIFGFPIIYAPYEADSQLAYLQKKGIIDYVVSDDMDLLVFGSSILLKQFTVSSGKYICEINRSILLKDLGVTDIEFIEISILMGSDYNENEFGPINAYKNIKKYGSIINLVKKKIIVNRNYSKIINYFKNPVVDKIKKISGSNTNKNIINKKMLIFMKKNGYSKTQIDKLWTKIEHLL